jgi:hypothetical protein
VLSAHAAALNDLVDRYGTLTPLDPADPEVRRRPADVSYRNRRRRTGSSWNHPRAGDGRTRWAAAGNSRRGLPATPPEARSETTRGALQRLPDSHPAYRLERTAADLLRATVDTVLHRAIRSTRPGIDEAQLGAIAPTARGDEEEVNP